MSGLGYPGSGPQGDPKHLMGSSLFIKVWTLDPHPISGRLTRSTIRRLLAALYEPNHRINKGRVDQGDHHFEAIAEQRQLDERLKRDDAEKRDAIKNERVDALAHHR